MSDELDDGWARAARFGRTVRHLAPAQLGHRVRLRGQKALLHALPEAWAVSLLTRASPYGASGWPEGFTALDALAAGEGGTAEAITAGSFDLLHEVRQLEGPSPWEPAGVARLWRYHLHYLEWGWLFARHPDREWASRAFRGQWRSWSAGTRFGRWDAWSPYVASVRAWALCGLFRPLVLGTADEAAYVAGLRRHAGFLTTNLELDVGGNHLVKNLKALVGLGVFLQDDTLVERGRSHLQRQLPVQVLADGGHFERSPSYHAQVLGDLVDVGGLLAASGRAPVPGLHEATAAMRSWLSCMLAPDGDVWLLNDCSYVGSDRLGALGVGRRPRDRLLVLADSGYLVASPGARLAVALDVGSPCPAQLPAHAHADTLTFELALDGRRVIVDTGTSTYQDTARRRYERSTGAHNTVEVDGRDSTEVWGTFRAGRLANASLESVIDRDGVVEVVASHDGYRHLGGRPLHRRRWRLRADRVDIDDEVTGGGEHTVAGAFHIAPGVPVSLDEDGATAKLESLRLSVVGGRFEVRPAEVATAMGRRAATSCLVVRVGGRLPLSTHTTIEVDL
ncbi:MAG: heparinase [Acidimicrobiia bacterium]|nr:heparinase [Acidimicrobiia bacterium]